MLHATEQRSLADAGSRLSESAQHAEAVLERVRSVHPLPTGARIADIGAAQGLFLVSCARLGYDPVGVEPWQEARETALRLAESQGVRITVVDGVMEKIPLPDNSFDFVHANSVIEHVTDAKASFEEAFRILKSGGIFWFSTASSMCPRQNEIRGFPAFGWYPDFLKRRIMDWAKSNRPHLIGHTSTPAYHWFTPWKARRMLRDTGFKRIYDRWDLRRPNEGGAAYRMSLRMIRFNALTKLAADIAVPCCSYAAVK